MLSLLHFAFEVCGAFIYRQLLNYFAIIGRSHRKTIDSHVGSFLMTDLRVGHMERGMDRQSQVVWTPSPGRSREHLSTKKSINCSLLFREISDELFPTPDDY